MGAFSDSDAGGATKWACELLEPFGNDARGAGSMHPWWIADDRLGSPQDVALFGKKRLAKDEALHRGSRPRLRPRSRRDARHAQLRRSGASRGGVREAAAGAVDPCQVKAAGGRSTCLSARARSLRGKTPASSIGSQARPMSCSAPSRASCFFSINPRMLASKRGSCLRPGRPGRRLLLETSPVPAGRALTMRPPSRSARRQCSKPSPTCVARPANDLAHRIARMTASFALAFHHGRSTGSTSRASRSRRASGYSSYGAGGMRNRKEVVRWSWERCPVVHRVRRVLAVCTAHVSYRSTRRTAVTTQDELRPHAPRDVGAAAQPADDLERCCGCDALQLESARGCNCTARLVLRAGGPGEIALRAKSKRLYRSASSRHPHADLPRLPQGDRQRIEGGGGKMITGTVHTAWLSCSERRDAQLVFGRARSASCWS